MNWAVPTDGKQAEGGEGADGCVMARENFVK